MGNYFIKIDDSPDVRRKLLESSKASLHILKSYHDLLKIRGEKVTQLQRLRTELRELTILINRAESLMPQFSDQELAQLAPPPAPKAPAPKPVGKWVKKGSKKVFIAEKPEHHEPKPEVQEPEQPKPRPLTELERLEMALNSIEGKLGKL
jgi:hypothetical protein